MKTLSYALQQICSGFSITRNDTLALKHKRKAEELAHDSPGLQPPAQQGLERRCPPGTSPPGLSQPQRQHQERQQYKQLQPPQQQAEPIPREPMPFGLSFLISCRGSSSSDSEEPLSMGAPTSTSPNGSGSATGSGLFSSLMPSRGPGQQQQQQAAKGQHKRGAGLKRGRRSSELPFPLLDDPAATTCASHSSASKPQPTHYQPISAEVAALATAIAVYDARADSGRMPSAPAKPLQARVAAYASSAPGEPPRAASRACRSILDRFDAAAQQPGPGPQQQQQQQGFTDQQQPQDQYPDGHSRGHTADKLASARAQLQPPGTADGMPTCPRPPSRPLHRDRPATAGPQVSLQVRDTQPGRDTCGDPMAVDGEQVQPPPGMRQQPTAWVWAWGGWGWGWQQAAVEDVSRKAGGSESSAGPATQVGAAAAQVAMQVEMQVEGDWLYYAHSAPHRAPPKHPRTVPSSLASSRQGQAHGHVLLPTVRRSAHEASFPFSCSSLQDAPLSTAPQPSPHGAAAPLACTQGRWLGSRPLQLHGPQQRQPLPGHATGLRRRRSSSASGASSDVPTPVLIHLLRPLSTPGLLPVITTGLPHRANNATAAAGTHCSPVPTPAAAAGSGGGQLSCRGMYDTMPCGPWGLGARGSPSPAMAAVFVRACCCHEVVGALSSLMHYNVLPMKGDLVATLSYVLLLCSRAADGKKTDDRPHFASSGGGGGGACCALPASAGRSSSSSVGCGAGGGLELQPDWLLTALWVVEAVSSQYRCALGDVLADYLDYTDEVRPVVVRSEAWWRRRLLPRQVELLAACGWVATAEAAELAAAGAALRATGAALGGLVALVTQDAARRRSQASAGGGAPRPASRRQGAAATSCNGGVRRDR